MPILMMQFFSVFKQSFILSENSYNSSKPAGWLGLVFSSYNLSSVPFKMISEIFQQESI